MEAIYFMRRYSGGISFQNTSPVENYEDNLIYPWNPGISHDSSVVLITTDPISDKAALRFAIKTPAPYIGMMGSIAKCKINLEHLWAE